MLAQTEKIAFEKYGVAEGLPEEYISSIIQDDQGFIWLTTQNGLVKYDGYNLRVYRGVSDKKDSTSLQLKGGNGGLIKAKDGTLWVGSYGQGIASFDPKTERFKNYLQDPKNPDGLSYFGNEMLFGDSRENIWFFNGNRDTLVLARLDRNKGTVSTYPHEQFHDRYNDIVLNFELLEVAADSSVWQLKHPGTLNVWDDTKDSFEEVIPSGAMIPGTSVKDTIRLIAPGNDQHFLIWGDHGLYVWDPVQKESIKAYTNYPDEDNTLLSYGLLYAFQDILGQIWIFQEQGNITLIDPEKESIVHFKYGEGPLKFVQRPKKIDQLSVFTQNQHGIWFGTTSGYTAYSQGEPFSYIYYDFSTKSFIHFNEEFNDDINILPKGYNFFAFKALLDHSGLLWLGTRPNLYKQAPKNRQIELIKHDPKDPRSIPNDTVFHLFEDSKNRFWVGTKNGIALHLTDGDFQQHYSNNVSNAKMSLGDISAIYEDSKGQLWVASAEQGLHRWNENRQIFERIFFMPDSKGIRTMLEDAKGQLWVSIYGRGVYILDGNTGALLTKLEQGNKEKHLLESNVITDFFIDTQGTMWLGDGRDNPFGIFKYLEKEKRFKHYGNDPNDLLTLISNEIRFMTEDDLGRMWVGTDEGICFFDHEKDIFYRNTDGLKIPSTVSFTQASKGRMWISTYSGGGLVLIGPDINEVTFFGEEQGLLHNDISARGELVKDKDGLLWLPTIRGLSVFDTKTKSFKSYFEKDGIQKNMRRVQTLVANNGNIWLGENNGLNRIVPEKLIQKDPILPKMVITSMGINDSIYSVPDGEIFTKAVSYTEDLVLKHWQKNLSFNFVALHYLRSEDNLYSWKLENYDTDWSAPSKERRATYTNLSPGQYTFKVKGANADGVWNEEGASIHITIAPPWWQTWWAYSLYFLLFLFIGYRVHLYQKARTLKKAQEVAQKKELEQAKEIKKAYAELKATQTQLIQAEKMASLGELTAGIAHEIQNPLNFVNNFSEVNRELIEELKEEKAKTKKERDESLEEELLTDIDQNLEKISHHGKRADSIVKGMLQHSRTSSGEKEATDINVLADEYLRLAYHGLRAKDKSFNATLETDFDKKIGKIHVIPQDMGRVILNLITNAFHAVQERASLAKASEDDKYQPTVGVSTKKVGETIQIIVKDNGNGIPKKIIQKVFEPFFTTKPTGHGTGLGLSLSYDIVKAHGGTLQCTSVQNSGTEFIIELPLKQKVNDNKNS